MNCKLILRYFVFLLSYGILFNACASVKLISNEIRYSLNSGDIVVFDKGLYSVSNPIVFDLKSDLTLDGGNSEIIFKIDQLERQFGLTFNTNGYTLNLKNLKVNGNANLIQGIRIINSTYDIENSCVFIDNIEVSNICKRKFYPDESVGILVQGAYDSLVIKNSVVKGISRYPLTGEVGVKGTSGIAILPYDQKGFAQCVKINDSIVKDIYELGTENSANSFDYDGIKYFTLNDDKFAEGFISITNSIFDNIAGRSLKIWPCRSLISDNVFKFNTKNVEITTACIRLFGGDGVVKNNKYEVKAVGNIKNGLRFIDASCCGDTSIVSGDIDIRDNNIIFHNESSLSDALITLSIRKDNKYFSYNRSIDVSSNSLEGNLVHLLRFSRGKTNPLRLYILGNSIDEITSDVVVFNGFTSNVTVTNSSNKLNLKIENGSPVRLLGEYKGKGTFKGIVK